MKPTRSEKRAERPIYKNLAEHACSQLLESHGLHFSKRGWPDFFVWHPDGGLAVVEVKRKGTHKLKKPQQHIMEFLASCGIACYRWDPEDGFKRIYKSRTEHPIRPINLQIGETLPRPVTLTPPALEKSDDLKPSWYNPRHLQA